MGPLIKVKCLINRNTVTVFIISKMDQDMKGIEFKEKCKEMESCIILLVKKFIMANEKRINSMALEPYSTRKSIS